MFTLWAVWVTATGHVTALTGREAAEYIVFASVVVGAIGVLWRTFRGARAGLTDRAKEWFDEANVRANAPLIELVETIEHRTRELLPNGGESIADKVSRIELLYYSFAERSEAERQELRRMLDDLTARVDEQGP